MESATTSHRTRFVACLLSLRRCSWRGLYLAFPHCSPSADSLVLATVSRLRSRPISLFSCG